MGRNMEECDQDPQKGELAVEVAEARDEDSGENKTPLSRDPSLSVWCGDDQIERPIILTKGDEDGGSASETEDFELTLLRDGSRIGAREPKQRPNFFRQRSSHSGENAKGGRFASFDVGNGLHPSESRAKLELLEQSAQSSISAVIVLKTLFYVVVWYTFSTCLTLYNKTLLGDKLGKFPAPLLMNTFHFLLQAILSKAIICFHKGGEDSNTRMTWKDYFWRGEFIMFRYQKLKKGSLLEDGELGTSNGAETRYTIVDDIDCEDET